MTEKEAAPVGAQRPGRERPGPRDAARAQGGAQAGEDLATPGYGERAAGGEVAQAAWEATAATVAPSGSARPAGPTGGGRPRYGNSPYDRAGKAGAAREGAPAGGEAADGEAR
ncbi:MAG: hypothetical protein K6U79_00140 [Firmicutes bacterium]|nr:hypothetical protein [Bacillota bacterium]